MIITHTQDNIIIDLPKSVKKVGIKMSGGTDSTIVAYMLSKYVTEERNDIRIFPITIVNPNKPYQEIFVKNIINFLQNKFGNIYAGHCVEFSESKRVHQLTQNNFLAKLYQTNVIDCHFTGITKNPPSEVYEKFEPSLPSDDRTGNLPNHFNNSYRPLGKINKKGVAELYQKFNLLETLFPMTRSCEDTTLDFTVHCGECWNCEERIWGFESYVNEIV
jgi:hypothetical protein